MLLNKYFKRYFTKAFHPYSRVSDAEIVDGSWFGVIQWHAAHINPLKTKRRLPYLKTQSVPRSKHFPPRL